MAKKPEIYDKGFPASTVLITNLVLLATYASGAYLFFRIGLLWGALFIIYMIYMEISVLREGCRYCYYYGKVCAFGKGITASYFIKKGNPKKFCERQLTFKDFIPHMLVSFLPLIPGTILLLSGLDFLVIGLMAFPIIVNFLGNPIIYGKLACPHCKQGAICCPACEYFMKKEKKK